MASVATLVGEPATTATTSADYTSSGSTTGLVFPVFNGTLSGGFCPSITGPSGPRGRRPCRPTPPSRSRSTCTTVTRQGEEDAVQRKRRPARRRQDRLQDVLVRREHPRAGAPGADGHGRRLDGAGHVPVARPLRWTRAPATAAPATAPTRALPPTPRSPTIDTDARDAHGRRDGRRRRRDAPSTDVPADMNTRAPSRSALTNTVDKDHPRPYQGHDHVTMGKVTDVQAIVSPDPAKDFPTATAGLSRPRPRPRGPRGRRTSSPSRRMRPTRSARNSAPSPQMILHHEREAEGHVLPNKPQQASLVPNELTATRREAR